MKVTTLGQFENGIERVAEKITQCETALAGKLDSTGKAETAGTADNAIRDGEGNVIADTYLKKSDNVSVDLTGYVTKSEADNTYLAKTALNVISAVPMQSGNITYDGTAKTPAWLNYDPLKLQISGDYQNKTNAGTYQVGFKPISPCTWTNSSQNIQNTSWTIGKAAGSLRLSAESGSVNIDATSTFTVDRAGDGAITVTSSNSNIVTTSVNGNTVTITGKAAGSATITVKVAEGTNHFAPANKTYAVTVTKIPLNLSASISSAITYNTTGTITLNGNSGGGAVTATSANSSCVTVSSTTTGTVTVKCANYSATATQITINVAETTKYTSGNTTCNVTTAKATPTLTLSAESVVLTSANPSATFTVTTNSTGALSATSGNTDTALISLSDKTLTIESSGRGFTDVTVSVKETSNFMAESKIISVDTSLATIDMLKGRTLKQFPNLIISSLGSNFQVGDYFDITFPTEIPLDRNSIPANSTWRAVCIGIDHNPQIEGMWRMHFAICKNTSNQHIAFVNKKMNSTATNVGGWAGSQMYTWLNETFYNALPDDLKKLIKITKKFTDNTGNANNNSAEAITASYQKIWLLSECEIYGTKIYKDSTYEYEAYEYFGNLNEQYKQEQYEYFKNGNIQGGFYSHCNNNTTASVFTRSCNRGDTSSFTATGGPAYANHSDLGFIPCFTIGG